MWRKCLKQIVEREKTFQPMSWLNVTFQKKQIRQFPSAESFAGAVLPPPAPLRAAAGNFRKPGRSGEGGELKSEPCFLNILIHYQHQINIDKLSVNQYWYDANHESYHIYCYLLCGWSFFAQDPLPRLHMSGMSSLHTSSSGE